jgi:hypothetical protein
VTGTNEDWAGFRDLDVAVNGYCTYPDFALEALHGVIGTNPIEAFYIDRVVDLTPQGTSAWQEVAVLSGGRLLMWHSENELDDDGTLLLRTSMRSIPVSAILDIGLRTHRKPQDDGTFELLAVNLYLATGTPQMVGAPDDDGDRPIRAEIYRFSKRVDHDGIDQVNRLREFAQVASSLLARR